MNQQALDILFRTYWSSAGWRNDSERTLSDKDFAFAKQAGVMFDPVTLDHDEAVQRLCETLAECDRIQLANSFLASLGSTNLGARSALGSYAVFRSMRPHTPIGDYHCKHCGLYLTTEATDLNILNFERLKWGGVRHTDVHYALLDLTLFLRSEPREPTKADTAVFRDLIKTCEDASDQITSASLHKSFPRALKANKAERDVIIAILGFTGILNVHPHPTFFASFVPPNKRRLPERRFVDMPYPACWWGGGMGVHQPALIEYFGHVL